MADQRRNQNGEKNQQRRRHQPARLTPLQLNRARAKALGPHGHDAVQPDEQHHKRQLDVQPRCTKIVGAIGRNQSDAGQDRQQGPKIGQPAQKDALQSRQRLPRDARVEIDAIAVL